MSGLLDVLGASVNLPIAIVMAALLAASLAAFMAGRTAGRRAEQSSSIVMQQEMRRLRRQRDHATNLAERHGTEIDRMRRSRRYAEA
ncbi:MAG: hypothetical protein AAF899_10345 [Pseudomonadota bacterium]